MQDGAFLLNMSNDIMESWNESQSSSVTNDLSLISIVVVVEGTIKENRIESDRIGSAQKSGYPIPVRTGTTVP